MLVDLMKVQILSGSAALLWLAFAAAPAVSQGSATAGGFAERIDVELVNVDVWVTDSKGDPVTGLGAQDFEIQHDGGRVLISHFTEVRGSAVQPAPAVKGAGEDASPAVEPTASYPSHMVVYYDQSRLHPRNHPALVEGLEQLLDADGVEPERVLILRQNRGLSVEAAFGSSRPDLDAAITRLGEGGAAGIALETEDEQALQAIRDSWEQSQDNVGSASSGLAAVPGATDPGGGTGAGGVGGPRAVVGGVGSGAGPDACGMFLTQVQPILEGFARSRGQRVGVTLANLTDAASFLAGLPGVKSLLYLSDGLDLQPGAALASYASGLCPAGSAELLSGAMSERLTTAFLELTRHANANRVTFYSLQASGLRSPGIASAGKGRKARGGGYRSRGLYESSQRVGQREGLHLIAEETGGRAIFNRNDFGPELAKIGQDLQSYYSLAYQPPAGREGGKPGREHRIEVRLSDGSLTARYRRGYLEKDPGRWLVERIEGALNLGITDNPLGVRLGAGTIQPGEERPGAEATFRLPLHVMVPVERLAFLPQDGGHVAEITVRAMARSLASGAVATRQQTYRVKGSPGAEGFANLVLELELGAGSQLTAIGIRDLASREASFISTTLELGPGG